MARPVPFPLPAGGPHRQGHAMGENLSFELCAPLFPAGGDESVLVGNRDDAEADPESHRFYMKPSARSSPPQKKLICPYRFKTTLRIKKFGILKSSERFKFAFFNPNQGLLAEKAPPGFLWI
ncbi:hypothetical protein [Nitrospina gracilis]|uniref:hypothetical protein n=1 Tax=Nitrospina gracilis TaxID=35801 RepID=UPI001F1BA74D|nr:hypothetical protein [Nitrospina gracilis]MCF8719496.1 hypothetical protein [Nitrospina gracilis Nb-211]